MNLDEFKQKIIDANYKAETGTISSDLFGNPEESIDVNGVSNRKIEVFYLIRKSIIANAPYIIFFNGGPGIAFSQQFFEHNGYNDFLIDYNIIFMDQRGTGFSEKTTQDINEYKYFTSRYISYDAELIRQKILGENEKWIVFGQSFGGHLVRKYLELYSSSAYIGISHGYGECSPVTMKVNIEKALFRQVKEYLNLYPEDKKVFIKIKDELDKSDIIGSSTRSLCSKGILDIFAFYFGLYKYEKIHGIVENFENYNLKKCFLNEISYLGNLVLDSGILNSAIAFIDLLEGLTDEELYSLSEAELLKDGIQLNDELFSTVRLSKNVESKDEELIKGFDSDPIDFVLLCKGLLENNVKLYVIGSRNDSLTPIEAIMEEESTVKKYDVPYHYNFIFSEGNHREWKYNQSMIIKLIEAR